MQWSDFLALPYCVRIQSLWIDQLRQSLEKVSMLRSTKPSTAPHAPDKGFVGNKVAASRWHFNFRPTWRYFSFRTINPRFLFGLTTPTITTPIEADSAEGQPEVYRSRVGTKWAAHDAVDPRPARSVRGATEPGPESRHSKLGNLGSTTWNPTPPEPRRAGVPASPRFLFYTPESSAQLARTCACRSASRPKQTTHWPRPSPSQQASSR